MRLFAICKSSVGGIKNRLAKGWNAYMIYVEKFFLYWLKSEFHEYWPKEAKDSLKIKIKTRCSSVVKFLLR